MNLEKHTLSTKDDPLKGESTEEIQNPYFKQKIKLKKEYQSNYSKDVCYLRNVST